MCCCNAPSYYKYIIIGNYRNLHNCRGVTISTSKKYTASWRPRIFRTVYFNALYYIVRHSCMIIKHSVTFPPCVNTHIPYIIIIIMIGTSCRCINIWLFNIYESCSRSTNNPCQTLHKIASIILLSVRDKKQALHVVAITLHRL